MSNIQNKLMFCTVFAYGATGAGKTFTMKGTLDEPGIMFHTMMELYRRFDLIRSEKTCDIAISYLEASHKKCSKFLHTLFDYLVAFVLF